MRRLIMFIFLILSLLAMIAFTVTLDSVFIAFGISFDWNNFVESLKTVNNFRAWMAVFTLILAPFFRVYGIPLIIFLISFNGLFQVKRSHLR